MNATRYFLPHVLALSTSSPFWLGINTGLKSYRSEVFKKFPRTDIPDHFDSYSSFQRYVELLLKTNSISNPKKIWWDVRMHPTFPTLEFRVCDIPTRVDDTIAIAALFQAIVCKLDRLIDKNLGFRLYRRMLIQENKWRAVRYGLEGKLIDFGKNTEVPVRDLVMELLEFVDDVVDDLGSRKEIEHVHTILERGTSADRQLQVYRETNDLKAVVDDLIELTMENVPKRPGLTIPHPTTTASTIAKYGFTQRLKGNTRHKLSVFVFPLCLCVKFFSQGNTATASARRLRDAGAIVPLISLTPLARAWRPSLSTPSSPPRAPDLQPARCLRGASPSRDKHPRSTTQSL